MYLIIKLFPLITESQNLWMLLIRLNELFKTTKKTIDTHKHTYLRYTAYVL